MFIRGLPKRSVRNLVDAIPLKNASTERRFGLHTAILSLGNNDILHMALNFCENLNLADEVGNNQ